MTINRRERLLRQTLKNIKVVLPATHAAAAMHFMPDERNVLDVHHDVIRCPKHWEIVQRAFQKLRGGHAPMLSAVAEERNRSAAAAVFLQVPLAQFQDALEEVPVPREAFHDIWMASIMLLELPQLQLNTVPNGRFRPGHQKSS